MASRLSATQVVGRALAPRVCPPMGPLWAFEFWRYTARLYRRWMPGGLLARRLTLSTKSPMPSRGRHRLDHAEPDHLPACRRRLSSDVGNERNQKQLFRSDRRRDRAAAAACRLPSLHCPVCCPCLPHCVGCASCKIRQTLVRPIFNVEAISTEPRPDAASVRTSSARRWAVGARPLYLPSAFAFAIPHR